MTENSINLSQNSQKKLKNFSSSIQEFCEWLKKSLKQGTKQKQQDDHHNLKTHKLIINQPIIPPLASISQFLKTLVLDLDETLFHTKFTEEKDFDYDLHLRMPDGLVVWNGYIKLRPNVKSFIEELSNYYEIITFTASRKKYAEPLIDYIDSQKKFIKHRIFRDHCQYDANEKKLGKNLELLNRDLSQVIIIDNCKESFRYQPENGFLIESYYGNPQDDELNKLIPFLRFMSQIKDVRKVSEWFQIFTQNEQIEFTNNQNEKMIYDKRSKEIKSQKTIETIQKYRHHKIYTPRRKQFLHSDMNSQILANMNNHFSKIKSSKVLYEKKKLQDSDESEDSTNHTFYFTDRQSEKQDQIYHLYHSPHRELLTNFQENVQLKVQ